MWLVTIPDAMVIYVGINHDAHGRVGDVAVYDATAAVSVMARVLGCTVDAAL